MVKAVSADHRFLGGGPKSPFVNEKEGNEKKANVTSKAAALTHLST